MNDEKREKIISRIHDRSIRCIDFGCHNAKRAQTAIKNFGRKELFRFIFR